jgi:hypothetical protein
MKKKMMGEEELTYNFVSAKDNVAALHRHLDAAEAEEGDDRDLE